MNRDIINKNKNKNKNTKKIINIDIDVKCIKDLIKICDIYPLKEEIEYNVDINVLNKIKEPLIQLDNMIGMKSIKKNILDQIIFYIQDLHIGTEDYMHTVIYGPPGTGKTEVAKIIGEIFTNLGILKKGTFKKVTRSDLIAGYLGQTAIKTREVIESSLDGVLFIDEAYALGNPEKKDSFSKECIDTLCEALSNHKNNLMVIIAGYDKELNECFFNYNKGLDSRFTWRYKMDDYNGEDLYNIFVKKVNNIGWKLTDDINIEWFKKNKESFPFYGRDMESLLSKTKIVHSRRIFGKLELNIYKKYITIEDLEKGYELYLKNEYIEKIKQKEDINNMISNMYI